MNVAVPPGQPDLPYPPNPDYGAGAMRRRIELTGSAGSVVGWLSDNFHEMTCTVLHDGNRITRVSGEMVRFPTTACPGAVAQLAELVGTRVDTKQESLFAGGRARRNCTHLFDLVTLAVAHAGRGPVKRRYDVLVPDEQCGEARIEVRRDGEIVHAWTVRGHLIAEPSALAGRTLARGFAGWARETWQGEDLEAALVLARVHYLAVGRRWLTEVFTGESIARNAALSGICHAYSPEIRQEAVFLAGARREFADGIPERRQP